MAQSVKLQLRQQQGLHLTPQLMQSINLLQMNAVELNDFILSEVEKNPLLELNPHASEFPEERRSQIAAESDAAQSDAEKTRELGTREGEWSQGERDDSASINDTKSPASLSEAKGNITSGSEPFEFSGNAGDLEAWAAEQQDLRSLLLQQAALTFRNPLELRLAGKIIDLIDEDGYLRDDLNTVATKDEFSPQRVEAILAKIQQFDPPGVGARNLGECMRLQLIEKNRLDPAMEIFTDNLHLLAKQDYDQLSELCKVDREDLIDMAREIKDLEPRPGAAFSVTPVHHIAPDVYVKTKGDGSWHIELNTGNLPKILINREYYAEIKDLGLKQSERKFMVDNLQNANWLVASLDQRAQTILKVATEIVRQQDLFFVNGKEYLKPLTLKQVGEKTDLHESTISRVTRNKFLACDKGIFELKYFFMSAISGKEGAPSIGGKAIMEKIRTLIEAETADNILSDDKLVQLLAEDGVEIARRTIAKYRESMGILSSIQRRRARKAGL